MEGYRDPAAAPSKPPLAHCDAHNLSYDPQVQPGCTICRRQAVRTFTASRAPGKTTFIVLGLIFAAGIASVFLYQRWVKSKAARIGEPCEARFGCVEGATCMGRGLIPSHGTCVGTCASDDACGGDKRKMCHRGLCVGAANLGEECGGDVECRDSACVTLVGGGGGQCLATCSMLEVANDLSSSCPAGTSCARVNSSIAPLEPSLASYYCIPNAR